MGRDPGELAARTLVRFVEWCEERRPQTPTAADLALIDLDTR